MAAVAERAGVTRRAVYPHFGSRAELLTGLFDFLGQTERVGDSLRRVWAAPDAAAALQEGTAHLGRVHPRVLAVHLAIEHVRRSDPEAAAYWERVMGNWRAGCRRLAAWLHDEGRLAEPWTPASAADMLWALMSFDVLECLLVHRGWTPERYAGHMAALPRATFTREPASTS
jgi:AcrR family transcriptional regulator